MAQFGKSDWMKNKKTFVIDYTRISDNQQSKEDSKQKDPKKKPALIQQRQFNEQGDNKRKADYWEAEVASGTDRDRNAWARVMAKAMEMTRKGYRVYIRVKDPSRASRNTRHAMVFIDRLHDMGVPIFAVREGIQTGSVGDLHPTEELLFVQLLGGGSFVSQTQKKKADESVELSKEAGVMSSKGQPLFPFARMDPLEAYYEQLPLNTLKASEGGGPTVFKETVAAMTAPNGVSVGSMKRFIDAEEERREKLNESEYETWKKFRDYIRGLLKVYNHDPFANNTEAGPINFKARALMRMVGRYLKEPWNYVPRSDSEIEEILTNYKQYLGTKDLIRYRTVIGKR
jgi:hypothetical protein